MYNIREFVRLALCEWSDEAMVMIKDPPVVKDIEAPEDENIGAKDPYSNANNSLMKSKAQAAGAVRGSGRTGAGRQPGGPNQGVTGH